MKIYRRTTLPEYRVHRQMLQRCYLKSARNYKWYGAKGVTVCDRWRFGEGELTGFECFIQDLGRRPDGLTLDRIDPSKPYDPSNCRWASWAVQAKNHRAHQLPEAARKAYYRARAARGERHGGAKLTEVNVAAIKGLIRHGARGCDIASQFGVTEAAVCDIKHGRSWSHVEAA